MAEVNLPHPGHDKHLCFLENIGYVKSNLDAYNPFSGKVFMKRLFLDGFRRYSKMCSRRNNPAKNAKNHCISCKKGLDML